MKIKLSWFFLLAVLVSISFSDYNVSYINSDDYEYAVWLEDDDKLIIRGGGADMINAWDNSRVEIRSTSLPLGLDEGGVFDIDLSDNSSLLFIDGASELITVFKNATATIKGGHINYLSSFQNVSGEGNITLECQPCWSWLYTDDQKTGITGLWVNDDAFSIGFIDKTQLGYDPVWQNIKVVEIPEPATLMLLGVGTALLRRKRH